MHHHLDNKQPNQVNHGFILSNIHNAYQKGVWAKGQVSKAEQQKVLHHPWLKVSKVLKINNTQNVQAERVCISPRMKFQSMVALTVPIHSKCHLDCKGSNCLTSKMFILYWVSPRSFKGNFLVSPTGHAFNRLVGEVHLPLWSADPAMPCLFWFFFIDLVIPA